MANQSSRLILVTLLVFAATCSASGSRTTSTETVEDGTASVCPSVVLPIDKLAPKPRPLPKPDFALTARAIAEEFGKDAGSAKKKYASKIIRLEGRVQKVGTDDSGVPYIELEGDGERTIGIGFATSQEAYVREIKKGQDVVLQGSYFIFLSNEISLNDGGIVVDPD